MPAFVPGGFSLVGGGDFGFGGSSVGEAPVDSGEGDGVVNGEGDAVHEEVTIDGVRNGSVVGSGGVGNGAVRFQLLRIGF